MRHPDQDQPLAQHQFPNTPAGFKQLRRWLRQHGATQVHACMEATSRYGEALALFLHQQQQQVSVVNPRRIRHYAQSLLVRTQHDALDADLIARFCATQKPRLWAPAPAELRQLQELTRLRQFLVSQRTRLQNRLHTEAKTLARLLRRHIRQLDKTIEEIETTITGFLQDHEELNRQVALVDTISGVGPITAAAAVAELPPPGQLDHAGQAVALAGLDPRKKDSGKSVRGVAHVSKMGSRPLRAALYMAAVTALRCNPLIRAQADRLHARGKSGKTVICAAMRKLVRLIYGVLKHGQAFDPKWQERPRAVPCAEAEASGGDGRQPAIASPPVATA
ncbi:MAG TPA: transposase [Verrucomicrobiae bacterium]|nr:transposase [Verrucomicrobiae bacterium]